MTTLDQELKKLQTELERSTPAKPLADRVRLLKRLVEDGKSVVIAVSAQKKAAAADLSIAEQTHRYVSERLLALVPAERKAAIEAAVATVDSRVATASAEAESLRGKARQGELELEAARQHTASVERELNDTIGQFRSLAGRFLGARAAVAKAELAASKKGTAEESFLAALDLRRAIDALSAMSKDVAENDALKQVSGQWQQWTKSKDELTRTTEALAKLRAESVAAQRAHTAKAAARDADLWAAIAPGQGAKAAARRTKKK